MNKERLLRLANILDGLQPIEERVETLNFVSEAYIYGIPEKALYFDMSDWKTKLLDLDGKHCGTACCIAGWTLIMGDVAAPDHQVPYLAQEYLDLTLKQAASLFTPLDVSLPKITPQEAALTIRKLVETGIVDWSHAASYTGDL